MNELPRQNVAICDLSQIIVFTLLEKNHGLYHGKKSGQQLAWNFRAFSRDIFSYGKYGKLVRDVGTSSVPKFPYTFRSKARIFEKKIDYNNNTLEERSIFRRDVLRICEYSILHTADDILF